MKKLIYPFSVLRVFWNLKCNMSCGYCSMKNQPELWCGDDFKEVNADVWIKAFERLEPTRENFILTPCNAEAPIYPGAAEITNSVERFKTHMYTNLSTESMKEIRLMKRRENLIFYVSYHRGQISKEEFAGNAKELQKIHNVLNFHSPMYPPFKEQIEEDARYFKENGIELNMNHEYLGMYKGEMHYSYLGGGDWIKDRFAHRLEGTPKRKVLCKTSPNHDSFFSRAYTVAPDGDMYTCWRHLYNKNKDHVIGSFFDEEFQFEDKYYKCDDYGDCNICAWHKDIKDAETGEQLDRDVNQKFDKTISVCMITGKQEDLIKDALLSVVSWADEIVLVDTVSSGKKDKTMEIAREVCGDKLKEFKFPWIEDFSAARNFSMSKATKGWIFILDTDERVQVGHGENLKKMLPEIQQDVIAVDVLNLYMDKETKKRVARSRHPSLRVFRRDYKPRYEGCVHNRPVVTQDTQIYRLPLEIYHLGYDLSLAEMEVKYNRTVTMCRAFTIKEPKNPESWFHLVRILKVRNGVLNKDAKDEIYESIDKGLAACSNGSTSPGNPHYDINNIEIQLLSAAGWIYHFFEDHKKAIEFGKRALIEKSDYLDAIMLIGAANTYGLSLDEGERWAKRYLDEQSAYDFTDKLDSLAMEYANNRSEAYKMLMQIEQTREAAAASQTK